MNRMVPTDITTPKYTVIKDKITVTEAQELVDLLQTRTSEIQLELGKDPAETIAPYLIQTTTPILGHFRHSLLNMLRNYAEGYIDCSRSKA